MCRLFGRLFVHTLSAQWHSAYIRELTWLTFSRFAVKLATEKHRILASWLRSQQSLGKRACARLRCEIGVVFPRVCRMCRGWDPWVRVKWSNACKTWKQLRWISWIAPCRKAQNGIALCWTKRMTSVGQVEDTRFLGKLDWQQGGMAQPELRDESLRRGRQAVVFRPDHVVHRKRQGSHRKCSTMLEYEGVATLIQTRSPKSDTRLMIMVVVGMLLDTNKMAAEAVWESSLEGASESSGGSRLNFSLFRLYSFFELFNRVSQIQNYLEKWKNEEYLIVQSPKCEVWACVFLSLSSSSLWVALQSFRGWCCCHPSVLCGAAGGWYCTSCLFVLSIINGFLWVYRFTSLTLWYWKCKEISKITQERQQHHPNGGGQHHPQEVEEGSTVHKARGEKGGKQDHPKRARGESRTLQKQRERKSAPQKEEENGSNTLKEEWHP